MRCEQDFTGGRALFSLSLAVAAGGDDGSSACAGDAGALIAGSAREICLVSRLSGGGALLRLGRQVEVGRRFDLEIGGERLAGAIAWSRSEEAALAFDERLDVLALVARNLANQPGDRRRLPRLEIRAAATLDCGAATRNGMVLDISQGGAKLELDASPPEGTPVLLRMEGLRGIAGEVRWHNGSIAGIVFSEELAWQELMPWLRARQDEAFRAAGAEPAKPIFPVVPTPPAGPHRAAGEVQLALAASVRDGRRRWNIEVAEITARSIRFLCYGSPAVGTLLWVKLPGLEGWACRVSGAKDGELVCDFLQPLHPAVLERLLGAARDG